MAEPTQIKDMLKHLPIQETTFTLPTSEELNQSLAPNGFKYVEKGGEILIEPIKQNTNKPLHKFFETAVGDDYRHGNLDDFQTSFHERHLKAFKIVNKYLVRFKDCDGTGFYMYSDNPGSGKTMLSCLLASAISKRYNVSSQAISAIQVINMVKETFTDERKSEYSVLNPLKAVDVLVLDEIGAESHTDYREEIMYEIINHRYNKKKPTFYTSNTDTDNLSYHPRIRSRISGTTIQIMMPDIDMRKEIRNQKNKQLLK